jgi:N,N'-diacetyllegionaminate synthase
MTRTFIIAEAGVNHNGSLEMALKLVDLAASCGADAVKFQTFRTELSITKAAPKADYQKQNTGSDESQFDMVKKLELSFESFQEIFKHCELRGIEFLSTPFDLPSVDFLASLGMPRFKVASGEITNLPLLRKIGRTKRPVILSTGMCAMNEITAAIRSLEEAGSEDIQVLHCNTEYPTPFADVNLNAMATIGKITGKEVGYSDHSIGIEVPIAAVAMGAKTIEKHFTFDNALNGPDHKSSLNPHDFQRMVHAIRNIEMALGSGSKQPSESEIKNLGIARKSIVARTTISKGELFSEANITTKRPGTGISPMQWDSVIGRPATRSYCPDELIEI